MVQKLTVHDIARLAGVSAMTVSRALSQPERVSPAMRAKVQDVVQRTGFVPNAMAGGLRSARARLVAAVLPTLTGPVFQETVQALNQALVEQGYQLLIGQGGYATGEEDGLLHTLLKRRPDGIVLTGIVRTPQARRQLLTAGIPVVETWDLTPSPIDMLVGFSNEQIGETVCAYLQRKGYQRPALLCGNDDRARRRAAGFVRWGAATGYVQAPPIEYVQAPTTLALGRQGLQQLLHQHPRIDAVFCTSDMLALGVLIEAQARRLRVPQHLGVVGMGDLDFAACVEPALTTVRINGTRIGRTAAQFIHERAEGRTVAQPVQDIGFELVERASA